jgi:hypothetical protein
MSTSVTIMNSSLCGKVSIPQGVYKSSGGERYPGGSSPSSHLGASTGRVLGPESSEAGDGAGPGSTAELPVVASTALALKLAVTESLEVGMILVDLDE